MNSGCPKILNLKIYSQTIKIYMYRQKLFYPTISFKTIQHVHPALQNAINNMQKIDREFLLVEGIQAKISSYYLLLLGQKGHYRKDCHISTSTSPGPDHMWTCSPLLLQCRG